MPRAATSAGTLHTAQARIHAAPRLRAAAPGRAPPDVALRYSPLSGCDAPRLACGCFAGASITDAFDGYLARRWRVESRLGAFLDPVADKLLVVTTLVALTASTPGVALPAVVSPWVQLRCPGDRVTLRGGHDVETTSA